MLHTQEPGNDPMDVYSEIIMSQELHGEGDMLGILFERARRADPNKPGRTLSVGWDERQPLVKGFRNAYSYTMRFRVNAGDVGVPAGRHYHKVKDEIMRAIVGSFAIALEHRETQRQVRLELNSETVGPSGEPTESYLYVPAGIAHAVRPLSSGQSALEVMANHPNSAADEFPYDIAV